MTGGAKGKRPGLERLMHDARCRRFDAGLVWKLDRFGRSLVHCISGIQELVSLAVRFIAVSQGIDTDAAPGSRRVRSLRVETALPRWRTQKKQHRLTLRTRQTSEGLAGPASQAALADFKPPNVNRFSRMRLPELEHQFEAELDLPGGDKRRG